MAFLIPSRPEIVPARSLVIAAGGGRDLAWPHQRVAAELLARTGGRPVHLLLHGGARGADAAIGRAAHQLGWASLVMPAQWQLHGRALVHSSPGRQVSVLVVAFPGGAGTASLVQQARRMASRSPASISVAEVSPSAGLWVVPSASRC
ncbi:hypothetical protein KBY57_11915 [Cyanobium sp. Aljojuca 7D2]|uniref:DUF2493 domain-containing protein n=1 Tax=Cyanobium sp. Aljojuca 7D2 TaxID=2823698 RepID=UPI0020CE33CB|nr:DUF2493 domain-containing protein [Cyanobium sp. Aljojuca 7D2]MCP9891752.1 hypothetical protein [Cyanobium sp. Aljojuca 7D2]